MKRRILSLALCLALALTLLPFGAFAANQGAYTLDLQSGTASPDVKEGEWVVNTLNFGVDNNLIDRKIDSAAITKTEARYDLDKNGTYDLYVKVTYSSKKEHIMLKTEFAPLDSTNLSGDKKITLPSTASGDYYSPLTLKFPHKMASITAKITFDANGGTGDMAAVTVVKNKDYTLPECTFTAPEGKEFDKWDLGAAGETVKITADTTITAQWKDKDTTPKNIDNVEITFVNTDLKAGQKPAFEAKLSDETAAMATIKEEVWIDETDSFLISSLGTEKTITEGHTYSYGITLEPKEGYVFTASTGLKYGGVNYAQSAIGATLKAGGSGLELWDFLPDVDVIGESIDKLEVDLTKGGTIVAEPRCTALANTLTGADAVEQVKYSSDTIDLDKDGTVDLSFDASTGVIKLQSTMSLTDDVTLTLSEEGITYITDNALIPYVKAVEFKMAPTSRAYELDLSAGKVTLTGEDAEALFNALQADSNGGLITLTKPGDFYDVDLDKDGTNDLKITVPGSDLVVEAQETSSVGEKIVLDTPLYDLIAIAGAGNPYLSQLTVRFKETEPAKDLGSLTIDLSKEESVTLTKAEFEGLRGSLSGLNFIKVTATETDGDVVRIDADRDGKFDLKAEKQADGGAVLSLLEDISLTEDTTLTLNDAAVTVIDTMETYKEYYKTVIIKLTASEETPKENPFTDVKEGDYFYDAVLWAFYAEPQVTNGMTDTTFGPTLTVTRGQCVTFLWRAMGEPKPATLKNPFTDVPADQYYYKAVLWAVEKGITNGMTDTTFEPNTTLSTAHIITFLYRTLGIGTDGWYEEAADWAVKEHLLDGTNLMVAPSVNCPRGAVVTFLYRELGGKP